MSMIGQAPVSFRNALAAHITEQARVSRDALGNYAGAHKRFDALSTLAQYVASLPQGDGRLYSLYATSLARGGKGAPMPTYVPGTKQARFLGNLGGMGSDLLEPDVALTEFVCAAIDDVTSYTAEFLTTARASVESVNAECERLRTERESVDGVRAECDQALAERNEFELRLIEAEKQIEYLRAGKKLKVAA